MTVRRFGLFQFDSVGVIHARLDDAETIVEYTHELPPGVRPNRHASGPFCRFDLSEAPVAPGVYALTSGRALKYIGQSEDLARRFGTNGYGAIAARNCHHDGQATNCKVNSLVLTSLKAGERVEVWFHRTGRRKEVEGELLALLTPPWNAQRAKAPGDEMKSQLSKVPRITTGMFRAALEQELAKAAHAGQRSIQINAGDLHRSIGGYPGRNHRMPMCCQAMHSLVATGDRIVESPPKGKGPRLTIEYMLPRPG